MLSILCILITCWIIVRYRTCSKHEAGHDTTRNITSPIPLPTQSATCNLDLHEMQNLIAKSETLTLNGAVRHSGNGSNTVSERIILNSVTSKKTRNDDDFSCVFKVKTFFCKIEIKIINTDAKTHFQVKDDEFDSNTAQLHFPTGVETNQSNGATCVDDIAAVLPQNVHSNAEKPFASTPPNGNLKTTPNTQVSVPVIKFIVQIKAGCQLRVFLSLNYFFFHFYKNLIFCPLTSKIYEIFCSKNFF